MSEDVTRDMTSKLGSKICDRKVCLSNRERTREITTALMGLR